MRGNPWSGAEDEALIEITGDAPWRFAPTRYAQWAQSNGFPPRTHWAMAARLKRLGLTADGCGEWLTPGLIHKLLGIAKNRPKGWVDRWPTILRPCCPSGPNGRIYIRRRNLCQLAKLHPEEFRGISRSALVMLLESERLADQIVEAHPTPPTPSRIPSRPVLNITTGDRFPSVTAAARAVYVHQSRITKAAVNGWRAAGCHWAYADRQRQEAA
jgi:hypothetical protein